MTCGRGTLEMKRRCPVYGKCAGEMRKEIRCNIEDCEDGKYNFSNWWQLVYALVNITIDENILLFCRTLMSRLSNSNLYAKSNLKTKRKHFLHSGNSFY